MLNQAKTPEGKKFCVYCLFRKETLRRNDDARTGALSDKVDNYIFEDDFRMGLWTRLQMWSAKSFSCGCGCKEFTVDIETREIKQEGIFKPTPIRRVVFVCKSCGVKSYPDDTMRTHGVQQKGLK
jgi:hypothetical protein